MDTQARDSPEFLPTSATSGSPLAFQEGAQQTSKATVPMYNPGGKGSVLSVFAQPLTEGFYPWAEGLPGGSEGKECTALLLHAGLSPVVASRSYTSLWPVGFSTQLRTQF